MYRSLFLEINFYIVMLIFKCEIITFCKDVKCNSLTRVM